MSTAIITLMDKGISVDEACSRRVIGSDEDFQRLCNEDGSVKQHPKTTTFSLKNDPSKTVVINDAYLHIGLAVAALLLLVGTALLAKKLFRSGKA
jgi:hypothetical protein